MNEGVRSFDVALVYWEVAGWSPDYWEYFCASLSFEYLGWEDYWCWRTGEFLEERLPEAAVMRMRSTRIRDRQLTIELGTEFTCLSLLSGL